MNNPGYAERRAVLLANQGLLRHNLEEQNRLGLQEQNRLQAAVHAANAVVLAANIARQEAELAIAFDAGEANIRVARLAQDVRNAHALLAARIADLAALGPVAIGPHQAVAPLILPVLQLGGGVEGGEGPIPLVHVQEAAAVIALPPPPPPPPALVHVHRNLLAVFNTTMCLPGSARDLP